MMRRINRRSVLVSGAAATSFFVLSNRGARAAAKVQDIKVISQQPEYYHGWPTVARRKNGELVVVCSGYRETHVCPFGQVILMRSKDNGETWTWPQALIDTAIDDRDAGVLETDKGTLLVTTFTSLAYEGTLQRAIKAAGSKNAWPAERLRRWKAANDRLSAAQRKAALGVWMIRSTDGGVTWSALYDCLVDSPHGPVQLTDGRLLYAGAALWRKGRRTGVCQSKDDGKTWQWLAEIKPRPGDNILNYHELHAVETTDGKIIVQIRNHNSANRGETLQCESTDGGKTWSTPHSIGVWGLPSHLLRLRDGRLVMTYGYRRAPFGNQARTSEDGGRSWSKPITISSDGTSGDLGYPSTVELSDGTLLTVWYERLKTSPRAVLRQARWTLS